MAPNDITAVLLDQCLTQLPTEKLFPQEMRMNPEPTTGQNIKTERLWNTQTLKGYLHQHLTLKVQTFMLKSRPRL